MPVQLQPPAVGDWYQTLPDPPFEVVAVDQHAEAVEIQYFDGTVEEIDFDTWSTLVLIPTAAPEDWTGALDVQMVDVDIEIEREPCRHYRAWQNPLDEIDRW